MEEDDSKERLQSYIDVLNPALEKLKNAFVHVVNEKGDISKFQEAIRELDNARQLINSMENIGLVIGISKYFIITFPLTGDPTKDLGQNPVNLPES